MPYSYTTQKRDGYLLLTASGLLESVEDLILLSRALREEAFRSNCRRFLLDERTVVKTIDTHDLTVFGEAMINESTRMRLAVLYSPEDVSRLHWMETILRNRSLAYGQFSSFEEAEQWLVSPDLLKD